MEAGMHIVETVEADETRGIAFDLIEAEFVRWWDGQRFHSTANPHEKEAIRAFCRDAWHSGATFVAARFLESLKPSSN